MTRGARTRWLSCSAASWALALGVGLACAATSPRVARADGPYEGQWREGPMNIRVTVQSWGGDCGPRPQSTSTRGGGTFRITQAGDQLTFRLRRQRTTRTCWSENRAVRRVSSTFQAGTWRIVCRTPPADSRAETGTYTIQAIGNDRLQFRDESRYDWQLNESRCQANISTTQTFTRVSTGATEPEEPERPARCTPGDAARVALRPARADVQPGGEQCFTARVVDAQGCPVGRRASLRLAEGDGRVEGACFHAGDAPGEARVVASSGSLRAEARVTVRTMDLSDLIARRTETGSVGSGAPAEDASAETAARLTANEAEEEIDLALPLGVLALALILVGAAVILLRRRGGGASKTTIGGLPGVSVPAPEPARDPSAPPVGPPGEDMICPTCRRGFPPGTARCTHDDTTLLPYKDFAAGKDASGQAKENVCPVCGDRFPPTVRFCGKDGVALEPTD